MVMENQWTGIDPTQAFEITWSKYCIQLKTKFMELEKHGGVGDALTGIDFLTCQHTKFCLGY